SCTVNCRSRSGCIGWGFRRFSSSYTVFIACQNEHIIIGLIHTIMSNRNILMTIRGITPQELMYLEHTTKTFSEEQTKHFVFIYDNKRKNAQDILLFTLLGFLGFAGIQRFVINQVAMGIIYFLTLGFCWIGTIVDQDRKSTRLNSSHVK